MIDSGLPCSAQPGYDDATYKRESKVICGIPSVCLDPVVKAEDPTLVISPWDLEGDPLGARHFKRCPLGLFFSGYVFQGTYLRIPELNTKFQFSREPHSFEPEVKEAAKKLMPFKP